MSVKEHCGNCLNVKRQIIVGAHHPERYYPWVCVECLARNAENRALGKARERPFNWEENVMLTRYRPYEKPCKFCGHCEYDDGGRCQ